MLTISDKQLIKKQNTKYKYSLFELCASSKKLLQSVQHFLDFMKYFCSVNGHCSCKENSIHQIYFLLGLLSIHNECVYKIRRVRIYTPEFIEVKKRSWDMLRSRYGIYLKLT